MKMPFSEMDTRLWAGALGMAAAVALNGCQSMGKGAALRAAEGRVVENGRGNGARVVEQQAAHFHPAPGAPVSRAIPPSASPTVGHYY